MSKYIFSYIRQYKWLMGITVFLGVLTFLASAMLTFTSGYLITSASEMPLNILLLYVPIVGVRFFGIAKPVFHYLERLTSHNTVLKILAEMRVKLYNMLEPQALRIRSRYQTGDLIGTLADDIEHLQDAYIRTIFPTIVSLFLFLSTVVFFGIFDFVFAIWIAFCLSFIVFVYPIISLKILKKNHILLKDKQNHLYQIVTDAIFGISNWIISGRKHHFLSQFSKETSDSSKTEGKIASWNHARIFQLQVITGGIVIFVGLWAGHSAAVGQIMPVYIASFTLIIFPLLEAFLPTSQAIEKIPAYEESLKRLEYIESFKDEKVERKEVASCQDPSIRLKDVSYFYEDVETPAVNQLSLSIPKGKKIAILGKSGAGKSTLLQLLIGAITPKSGFIDIGGHSPNEYGEQIYNLISVLNQKPYLFATTVENNIRLGREDASREEIMEAIKQVKLDQYIQSLPKGLDTQMEETGQRFSGGERQRIALARILLKDTPIVIFDEPTVGLDPKTERELLSTIFETLEGKTLIFITHHLIGMENMDEIYFLDQGEIVMKGTHEELLKMNERYKKLYQLDRGYL